MYTFLFKDSFVFIYLTGLNCSYNSEKIQQRTEVSQTVRFEQVLPQSKIIWWK